LRGYALMGVPRKDVVAKVDDNIHKLFLEIARLKGMGPGALAEILIKECVAADHRDFTLRNRSAEYRRLSENFEDIKGTAE